ncbi:MAG: M15 family metallopeptidase [Oscillospiraceae bacterium]|nr:M15 family metallopeptidase [Oscillospiraceae bacterium]
MRTITLLNEDIFKGSLILVNKHCPYREDERKISLVSAGGSSCSALLERQSARLLDRLIDEVGAHDCIVAVSGWRSKTEQTKIYNDSLIKNGLEFTRKYVALPGCSEHQTGLAVDLAENKPDIDFICPDFPYDGICGKFREKASIFGFIERYSKGRENITEIGCEPWHFRYVGFPHAVVMQQRGFTLEEYHEFLKKYVYGVNPFIIYLNGRKIEISYLKTKNNETLLEIADGVHYTVSGNNSDGFIITVWR